MTIATSDTGCECTPIASKNRRILWLVGRDEKSDLGLCPVGRKLTKPALVLIRPEKVLPPVPGSVITLSDEDADEERFDNGELGDRSATERELLRALQSSGR